MFLFFVLYQLMLSENFYGWEIRHGILLFFVLYQLMLSENFYGWEIRHGILGGLKFGPGIFLGFV